jgi:hypothetical protein
MFMGIHAFSHLLVMTKCGVLTIGYSTLHVCVQTLWHMNVHRNNIRITHSDFSVTFDQGMGKLKPYLM